MFQSLFFNPFRHFVICARLVLWVLFASACLATASLSAETDKPPIIHLSDPGEWLISQHGARSIASAAGAGEQALLVVTGGALRSSGAPAGLEDKYAVAMLDAAGVDVANLAHRDMAADADSLKKALTSGKVQFVSASFRLSGQPWQPYTVIEKDGRKIAFIGIAASSPSMALPGRAAIEGLEFVPPSEAVDSALQEIKDADSIVLLADIPLSEALELRSEFPALSAILNSGRGGIQFAGAQYRGIHLSPPGGFRAAVLQEEKESRVVSFAEPERINPLYSEVQKRFGFAVLPTEGISGDVSRTAPILSRLNPEDTEPLNLKRENRAVRWTIHSAALLDDLGPSTAPEGCRWLVFDVEWENLLTPRVVREQELPVAYKIKELGNHLYLVEDGRRLLPMETLKEIPNLLEGKSAIDLPGLGSTQRGLLVYTLKSEAQQSHLEFRYYDFAHGHMTASVLDAGQSKIGGDSPGPVLMEDSNEIVTAGLYGMRINKRIKGSEAAEGMTFVEVEFRGRSMFTFEADASAFVPQAEPGETIEVGTVSDWTEAHKYTHLVVDGEYAYTPVSELTSLPANPRFLPDVATGGCLVFMVPESFESLALQADFPNARLPGGEVIRPEPVRFDLQGEPELAPERDTIWEVTDDSLHVAITALDRTGVFAGTEAGSGKQFLVLQVTIRNQGEKPEFFQTMEQLRHVDARGRKAPPHPATYEGRYRPVEHVWIPDAEQRTFQLAYLIDENDDKSHFSYRGYTLAKNIELRSDPEAGAVAVSTSLDAEPVTAPVIDTGPEPVHTKDSADREAETAKPHDPAAAKEQAMERLALHSLEIADADFGAPSVPMISGPEYGSVEDALPLEEPWMVRGKFERLQRHYFRLTNYGEPQLWYIEAAGANLEYRDPGGGTQLERRMDKDSRKASMAGLFLLPGHHWFSVYDTSDGDYTFRAVPLGPPDPHAEIEPNDDVTTAQGMDFGDTRIGRIYEPGDKDAYRFSTTAEENLAIMVEGPGDMTLRMELQEVYAGSSTRKIHSLNGQDIEYRTRLPAGDYMIDIFGRPSNQRSDHPYVLRLERADPFDTGEERSEEGELPVSISLGGEPPLLAAFWPDAQNVRLPLEIVNQGSKPMELQLEAHASQQNVEVSFSDPNPTAPPGGRASTQVLLCVPPDMDAGQPVTITVQASDSKGARVTTQAHLFAECAAPPQQSEQYWPLPEELLGGLNVAWTALGAEVEGEDREKKQVLTIFDGYTPFDGGYSRPPRFPREFTVRLAGDAPVPVVGVALHPQAAKGKPDLRTKSFDVLVSLDGQTFKQVFSGELDRCAEEQTFVFDEPVEARYARLRINSNHEGTSGRMMLGQWKVIASPGVHIPGRPPLNIASAHLGAHVDWADPFPGEASYLQGMLDENERAAGFDLREPRPIQWVVSFFQQRAARITELQWVDGDPRNRYESLSEIVVSASMESPLGPWTELGLWKLERTADGVAPFVLPEPQWARYLMFTSYDPDKSRSSWQMPKALRVIEQLPDESYRSITGEWGHYAQAAVYEKLERPEPEPFITPSDRYATRSDAHLLEAGTSYSGSVQVGENDEWHRIEIPDEADRLTLNLQGRPNLRVLVRMEDAEGEAVALQRDDLSPRQRLLRAKVTPGEVYYLRVYEPPRSIVFAWDNSGSMGPYKPAIYQGLRRFVGEVKPGIEYANFLPFQSENPKLLLPEWSDQSHQLWVALNNYHRQDDSSSAEPNLLAATKALADRDGARAILLLTDAETFGYKYSGELWQAMAGSPPQIFSVELHSGSSPPYQQNLMQSWAAVNNGRYNLFTSQPDIDIAFSRASCLLRRPAYYTLTSAMEKEEPPEQEAAESAEPEIFETLVQDGRVIAHGILFDVDSHNLRSQSFPVLHRIGSMLREHSDLRILIEGHTDSTGQASRNQVLSEKRAESVRRFLIDNYTIDAGRLESVGYGQRRPTDTNETAEGRQNNRRVELVRIDP
jgi:outer membrane protein OmpA-like peptidoglycan-associated protein